MGPDGGFITRTDSPFQRPRLARVGGAIVTFEPGARTAWHTHPLGQTLLVTAGCGRMQRDGSPMTPGNETYEISRQPHS